MRKAFENVMKFKKEIALRLFENESPQVESSNFFTS